MANSTESPSPTKASLTTIEELYTLYYKRGQTMCDFLFKASDLKTAIQKGKDYCAAAQVKFQNVIPAVHDIDRDTATERSRNFI